MEATLDDDHHHHNPLDKFIVGSVPTVIYIPDFISDDEHNKLHQHIYQAPVSKWKSLKNRRLQNWGGVVHEKGLLPQTLPPWLSRITQRIYAESKLFPSEINHVLINEYLPDQGIMPHQDGPAYYPVVAILSLGSPVVMDFSPHLSLSSDNDTLRNNVDDKISDQGTMALEMSKGCDHDRTFSVILKPRSLLIFKDKAYSDYLHGIKDCELQRYDKAVNLTEIAKDHQMFQSPSGLQEADDIETGENNAIHRTGTRVSLTCRVVTKVHKNLFKI